MKFKCINKDCKLQGKEIHVARVKTFIKNGEKEYRDHNNDIIHCEKCHQTLENIRENKGICANFKSRMNVNKPVSMDYWEDINRKDDIEAMGFDPRKRK